jgi:hypothetical protein
VSETKSPPAKSAAAASKIAAELKVSGHLMTFDAGLYCIFHPPGSAMPDAATGLPGVRLTLPPGPVFHPEAITISTFRDDGWLGWNGAALVRVMRGPAQIMVTIYQAPQSKIEAPRLQIMRLAEGHTLTPAAAGAASQQAVPATAAPPPQAGVAAPQNTPAGGIAKPGAEGPAEIVAHVQGRGDVTTRLRDWMGEPGSKQWIEGFSIAPKQVVTANDIEYQAVLGRGWLSPWAEGGQFCGSRGMSLPILGLRVRLRGEAAERLDCALTATFVDGTKIGPLESGEPAQAESLSPLEAFRIDIKPRAAGGAKPAAKASPAAPGKPAGKPPAKPQAKPAGKAAAPKRK